MNPLPSSISRFIWVVSLLLFAAMMSTRVAGSPAGADQIVKVTLQDPIQPQSKCYLDLDTGDTFANRDGPADFIQSHDWIEKQGIDLMCESRDPVNGLAMYDMTLVKTAMRIEDATDYASIRKTVDAASAEPFNMLSVNKSDLPCTYLFLTHDRALGVLEISLVNDAPPSGVAIRYRLLAPARPTPMDPLRLATQNSVQSQEASLRRMSTTYLPNHPLMIQAQRKLKMLKEIEQMQASESDQATAVFKTRIMELNFQLDELNNRLGPKSPQVAQTKHLVDLLDLQLAVVQSRAKANANPNSRRTGATTQPAATQPSAKVSLGR